MAQLLRPLLPPSPLPQDLVRHGWRQAETLMILRRSGLLGLALPQSVPGLAAELAAWGLSPVTAFKVSVRQSPDRPFVIDDEGTLTFAEADERTDRLALELREAGLREGEVAGILARNCRGFIEAAVALWKLGVDCVYLNTSFAGPELEEIAKNEKLRGILYDAEFKKAVPRKLQLFEIGGRARARTRTRPRAKSDEPAVIEPPSHHSRHVIMTSGTTGRAKGAPRSNPTSVEPLLALLSRIPLRTRETTLIAAPLFHAWGYAHLTVGLVLSSTLVLQRRFEPEPTLAALAENRASALAAVPVMLQRILELPPRTRRRHDLSSLRVVALSGSALSPEVAKAFMDEFGDVLYNLYGSTEVAWASIASPGDLRRAPGTAGRAPRGTVLRIYDDNGKPLPDGQSGRIFVGNEMQIESYTSGEKKDSIDGLMATGDLGHLENGLLFVEGRGDDMIVSGGENVYPEEVEEVLKTHPSIADAAVLGIEDPQFGQALKAAVVRSGNGLTEDDVREHVRSRLARFKVPKQVVFVSELPRNPAGKVLKRELQDTGGDEAKPEKPAPRKRRAG